MLDSELQQWQRRIDSMSHEEMARLWRNAPTGHPCFNTALPLYGQFEERFRQFGGMTSSVSKAIGWDEPQ